MMENDMNPALAAEPEYELEVANRSSRFFAFIMDFILALAIAITIIAMIVIPKFYPDAMAEMQDIMASAATQPDANIAEISQQFSPRIQEMLTSSQTTLIIAIWAYFALSEILTRGASLGKRTFSIQVINEGTLEGPGIIDSILRSGLKTLALLALFPILHISFLIIFLTRNAKTGHDLLTRTVVVSSSNFEDEEETED